MAANDIGLGNDPLAGISEKSTKVEMMARMNELADIVRGHERARTGKLGEIEKRVREKYKPGDVPLLHSVVFVATEQEWVAAIEFLNEFGDILPVALQRVRQGGKEILGPKPPTP